MPNLNMTLPELFDLFAQQQNWQARYRQLIHLAKLLPAFPQADKIARYHIAGCENNVWLKTERVADHTFQFSGDSDSRIVKGLLAILITLAQGKTAAEIVNMPFKQQFQQLKISEGLSESRLLGLDKLIVYLIDSVNYSL
ncbi:SufE family protein [Utexia brackfieldae]|uniref:SufE family protein n=1 Tax=Utexia brackfieldae TaxID=3074108 RepID=UPI00370DD267